MLYYILFLALIASCDDTNAVGEENVSSLSLDPLDDVLKAQICTIVISPLPLGILHDARPMSLDRLSRDTCKIKRKRIEYVGVGRPSTTPYLRYTLISVLYALLEMLRLFRVEVDCDGDWCLCVLFFFGV